MEWRKERKKRIGSGYSKKENRREREIKEARERERIEEKKQGKLEMKKSNMAARMAHHPTFSSHIALAIASSLIINMAPPFFLLAASTKSAKKHGPRSRIQRTRPNPSW